MNFVLAAMLGYVVVQFVIGALVSRRMTSEADYILAGRQLGPALVTFSVFASFFGAEAVVASAGAVYEKGLAGAWIDPFGYAFALLLVGVMFAGPLWRNGLTTFADLFARRYSPGVARLVVVMLLPGSIFWAAAQIRAFGQVLSANSSLDLVSAITIAALLVASYSVVGGLMADSVTDVIQGIALIAGLLILGGAVLSASGGVAPSLAKIGPERLNLLAEGHDHPLQLLEELMISVCGTIVSVELISRFLGARGANVAAGGTVAGACIYMAIGIVPVFLGLVGPNLIPGVADAEQIVPKLAEAFMPKALGIVFVGAIVSAILSTVHSALHAPASQVSHNIVVSLVPGISVRGKLWSVRLTVMGLSLVAYALALSAERIHDLVETASAFGSAGVFVVTLFALFTSFGGRHSAYAGLAAGMGVWLVARFVAEVETPYLLALAVAGVSYAVLGFVERKRSDAFANAK